MRVIDTDNFNGDYPDEKFVGPTMTEAEAKAFADRLNKAAGRDAARFYRVVPDDYELQPGFEP